MEGESTHYADEQQDRHEPSHYPAEAPGGRENGDADGLEGESGSKARDERPRSRSGSPYRARSPAPVRHEPPRPPTAPKDVEPTNIVGVFGLSIRTIERDLEDEFSRSGQVEKVVIVMDQRTGRSRGFGFVTMASIEDAERAIRDLNGLELHGRRLRVDFSATRKPHDPTPGQYRGTRRDPDPRDLPPPRYGDRYAAPPPSRYDDRYYDARDAYRGGGRYGGDPYGRPPPPARDYYPPPSRDASDRYAPRSVGDRSEDRYRSRSPYAASSSRRRSPSPRRRSPSPRRSVREDDY